jgi:hypothetical protein
LPLVGILDHATFSNIEEQHKHLYQDTLGPWLTMIEEEYALQLIPDFDTSGRIYVEFNLAEKLKGTFEEQAKIMQTMVGAPVMTRNEGRARLNLSPSEDPGADELVVPLNVLVGGLASPTDTAPPADSLEAPKAIEALAVLPATFSAKHEQVLGAFFDRQERSARSRFGTKSPEWWDGPRWDRELAAELYALGAMSAEHAAKAMVERFGYDPAELNVDALSVPVLAAAAELAREVNVATREKMAAGESVGGRLAAVVELAVAQWVAVAADAAAAQFRVSAAIGA